jgi:hypothetical protein
VEENEQFFTFSASRMGPATLGSAAPTGTTCPYWTSNDVIQTPFGFVVAVDKTPVYIRAVREDRRSGRGEDEDPAIHGSSIGREA